MSLVVCSNSLTLVLLFPLLELTYKCRTLHLSLLLLLDIIPCCDGSHMIWTYICVCQWVKLVQALYATKTALMENKYCPFAVCVCEVDCTLNALRTAGNHKLWQEERRSFARCLGNIWNVRPA